MPRQAFTRTALWSAGLLAPPKHSSRRLVNLFVKSFMTVDLEFPIKLKSETVIVSKTPHILFLYFLQKKSPEIAGGFSPSIVPYFSSKRGRKFTLNRTAFILYLQ